MYTVRGKGWVAKRRGHWQLNIRVRKDDGETFIRSMMTDIKCDKTTNRGKPAALDALIAFRRDLVLEYSPELAEQSIWTTGDVVQAVERYIKYLQSAKRIENQTAEGYEYSLKHIARGFAGIPVESVTPAMIMSWLAKSFEEGHSANVMKRALRLLNQYYRFLLAFPDPPVRGNPCVAVPCPQPHEKPPNPLRHDQIMKFNLAIKRLPDGFLRRACLIGIYTGLRGGEVCALLWSDIDWKRSEILVSRSAAKKSGGGLRIKETKGRERRIVPLSPVLERELKAWFESDVELRYRRGDTRAHDTVRTSPIIMSWRADGDATPLNPGRLSKKFSAFSEAHQLIGITGETITFHGIRHTFATQWIACGGDVAALSSVLGHKDPGFTLRVYVSTDPLARKNGMMFATSVLSDGWYAPGFAPDDGLVNIRARVSCSLAAAVRTRAHRRGIETDVLAGELIANALDGDTSSPLYLSVEGEDDSKDFDALLMLA